MDDFSAINEMDSSLFMTDPGMMDYSGPMDGLPLWFMGPYITLMILIYGLGPLLMILAARKNWNSSKSKEAAVGYCGFWKRLAIKFVDQILMIFIVPIFLNAYFYFRDGQTIADKMFGAKLVNKDTGEIADVGRLFIRPMAKIFSILALGIGFWPAGWRAEKNAWHDSLSDTRYISTRRTLGIWVILAILLPILLLLIPISVAIFIGLFLKRRKQ